MAQLHHLFMAGWLLRLLRCTEKKLPGCLKSEEKVWIVIFSFFFFYRLGFILGIFPLHDMKYISWSDHLDEPTKWFKLFVLVPMGKHGLSCDVVSGCIYASFFGRVYHWDAQTGMHLRQKLMCSYQSLWDCKWLHPLSSLFTLTIRHFNLRMRLKRKLYLFRIASRVWLH